MAGEVLRLQGTLRRRGCSKSTHYESISQGLMTRPFKPTARNSGWPDWEIDILNAARAAELPDEQIRVLVRELEAARPALLLGEPIETHPRLAPFLRAIIDSGRRG